MLPPAPYPTEPSLTRQSRAEPPVVSVRLNLEDHEYRVHDLTPDGFSVAGLRPVRKGLVTHASFTVPEGLTISVKAVAAACEHGATLQWFDFVDVDREVIRLLMMAAGTTGVH